MDRPGDPEAGCRNSRWVAKPLEERRDYRSQSVEFGSCVASGFARDRARLRAIEESEPSVRPTDVSGQY